MKHFWAIVLLSVIAYAIYKHRKQNIRSRPVSVVQKVNRRTTGASIGLDPTGVASFDSRPAPSGHGDATTNAAIIPPKGSTVRTTDYSAAFGSEENNCGGNTEWFGAYQFEGNGVQAEREVL